MKSAVEWVYICIIYIYIYAPCIYIYTYIYISTRVNWSLFSVAGALTKIVGQGTPGGGAASHCQSDASDGLQFY